MSEQMMDFGDADQAGECSVCGPYRDKIERGELDPCYKWKREKLDDVDGEDA